MLWVVWRISLKFFFSLLRQSMLITMNHNFCVLNPVIFFFIISVSSQMCQFLFYLFHFTDTLLLIEEGTLIMVSNRNKQITFCLFTLLCIEARFIEFTTSCECIALVWFHSCTTEMKNVVQLRIKKKKFLIELFDVQLFHFHDSVIESKIKFIDLSQPGNEQWKKN